MATWKGERGTRHERGYDHKWERLRNDFIRRNPECQHRGPGCKLAARIVHHVVPVSVRPELRLVRSNLMSVCDPCHRQLHDEACPGVVIAVVGAPGSGKTTHIEQHRQAGDLVWDWDDIAAAVGMDGVPLPRGQQWWMTDARDSLVSRVRAGTIPQTLWLALTSYTTAMQLCDQYIVMDRDQKQCELSIIERRRDGAYTARILEVIGHWFAKWGAHRGTQGTPPVQRETTSKGTTQGDHVFSLSGEVDAPGRVPQKEINSISRIIRGNPNSW